MRYLQKRLENLFLTIIYVTRPSLMFCFDFSFTGTNVLLSKLKNVLVKKQGKFWIWVKNDSPDVQNGMKINTLIIEDMILDSKIIWETRRRSPSRRRLCNILTKISRPSLGAKSEKCLSEKTRQISNLSKKWLTRRSQWKENQYINDWRHDFGF